MMLLVAVFNLEHRQYMVFYGGGKNKLKYNHIYANVLLIQSNLINMNEEWWLSRRVSVNRLDIL